jgi:hypothetical protein
VKTAIENTLHSPVVVTNHAIERANERFKIAKAQAANWVRQHLNNAKFVSVTTTGEGKEARLFANNGIAFVLDMNEDKVITIYEPYKNAAILEKVRLTALRELRKVERYEVKLERMNTLTTAELEVEKAMCKLDLLRARSTAKKNALQARINALQMRIDELNDEIINAKREKSYVAKAVAAYV